MKIGVLVKQVPARDSELELVDDESWIDEADLEYEISEADEYALEAALELKETADDEVEVIAISLGPERVEEALETALAKGADSAVHIEDDRGHGLDPFQVAGGFATLAREENFALILSGIQSDDSSYGQTPVLLAELLDFHHVTMAIRIERSEAGVKVRRELEAGWFQDLELPMPAVLTVQSGINEPRYASMKSIMAARRKTIRGVDGSDLIPTDVSSGTELVRAYAPEESKSAELLHGSPAEQAAALIEKLTYEARVL